MKICKRIKATVLSLCLIIGMCAASLPQTVRAEYGDSAYAFMKQLQSNYPYRQVNSSNGMLSGAEEWLKAQIVTMGYEYMAQPFTMTSADGVTPCYGENLIFSKQGASDRVIVVGAHYDCVEQTFGTDDNASGVGVLLELASIYSTKESPYTIRFILFSAEEPGCLVDDSGSIVQDWAVYQAQSAADLLGIDMSFHPDVNDSFPTPTKATASDQMPFANVGIPYIYCEASNWNGEPYTNFYQTSNSAVNGGTIMHKAEYDNLTFIENTFGTRAYEHLQAYAKLLDYLLENMKEGEYATGYTFEDTNTKATTTSSVYLREKPTQYSPSVTLLDADTEVTVTGYHASWCRVEADGQEGYIKTDYLTMEDEIASKEDESSEEESENASEEASKEAESSMSEESSSEAAENESEEAVSESESSSNEASKNETVSEAASSEKETDGALSQSASSQNASAPEADSQNTVEKIIDQLKNDPYTLRIVLIAAIIIIGIWLCVFIALRRKKNAQKNEDSNGASNSSEETLKKAKRADMSDSKDSDNGFADPDKNKDEK